MNNTCRATVPTSRRVEDLPSLRVFRASNDSLLIELPASPLTMVPGRYSIWFANGAGHACIGRIVATDDGGGPADVGSVTRLVERVDSGDLLGARAGIWSGYVYPTPVPLSLPYEDVGIPVENGACLAVPTL